MYVLLVMLLAGAVGAAFAGENVQQPGSAESAGPTDLRAHHKHEEQQPQGRTGPSTTGGAPAESPQGQSPPGMQAAPEGSSKSIVDK
jgi:hypothetical protein